VKVDPHKPTCYDIDRRHYVDFSFNETAVYSISWNVFNSSWDTSKELEINVYSWDSWDAIKFRWEDLRHENEITLDDKYMREFTLHLRVVNVFKIRLIQWASMSSLLCNVQIFALESQNNCEEPDSPLNGQHLWNRNDSVATFKCDDNFNLTSDLPLNCVHGNWIGLQPKCKQFLILNYLILVLITLSN